MTEIECKCCDKGMEEKKEERKDKIRFRCLVIDHDDTTVESTAAVHYPAHVRSMEELRPGQPIVDLDTWFLKNHGVGIGKFFAEEIRWTPAERARELEIWRAAAAAQTPEFYPGFLALLRRFVAAGGVVVTCTHSEEQMVRRHYAVRGGGFVPAHVYGWVADRSRMKPSAFPVLDAMNRFHLEPADILVLDDLAPGIQMGKAAGVATAAAGWGQGHRVPLIRDEMKAMCDYYFASVPEFEHFLFME